MCIYLYFIISYKILYFIISYNIFLLFTLVTIMYPLTILYYNHVTLIIRKKWSQIRPDNAKICLRTVRFLHVLISTSLYSYYKKKCVDFAIVASCKRKLFLSRDYGTCKKSSKIILFKNKRNVCV